LYLKITQMKYNKLIILYFLISFSLSSWAKAETDTITNWQVYKGSKLLFRSNAVDCFKLTGVIKKSDEFKTLKIVFFRDTKSYGKQKIKLLDQKKVVAQFDYENSEMLEITKSKIHSLFKKTKEYLTIMYYDDIEKKGTLLGYLQLEK